MDAKYSIAIGIFICLVVLGIFTVGTPFGSEHVNTDLGGEVDVNTDNETSAEFTAFDSANNVEEISEVTTSTTINVDENRQLVATSDYSEIDDENIKETLSFEEVAYDVGFDYRDTHTPGAYTMAGAGVYVADVTNNGYEDILAVGADPVLFYNIGGEFVVGQEFNEEDITAAQLADFTNTGSKDLVLVGVEQPVHIYENDGNGTFNKIGETQQETYMPTGVTTGDFSRNGELDFYVVEHSFWGESAPQNGFDHEHVVENHPDVRPHESDTGAVDKLFIQTERGVFEQKNEQYNVDFPTWALAASSADFTGNGHPDIHVANDFTSDLMFVNHGNQTFERVFMPPDGDRNGMSSVARDVTGNGYLEIFTTNIFYPNADSPYTDIDDRQEDVSGLSSASLFPDGNVMWTYDGDEYTNIADDHGLQYGGWGWAATLSDLNNNGAHDVVHTVTCCPSVEPYPDEYKRTQLWMGTDDSWIKDDSSSVGLVRNSERTVSISRGLSSLDYNFDGSVDIVMSKPQVSRESSAGGGYTMFENQHESNGDDFIQFYLRNPNGSALNADVFIETDERVIYEHTNPRSDFQSQESEIRHVAVPEGDVTEIRVKWDDSSTTVFTNVEVGNRYVFTPETGYEVSQLESTQ